MSIANTQFPDAPQQLADAPQGVAHRTANARPDSSTSLESSLDSSAGRTAQQETTASAGLAHCPEQVRGEQVLHVGSTTASYFWDDGSGRNGDTGAPASGLPMQKGLAASPSWPMGTKGYVVYGGKKAEFFIGDRGPGTPSSKGIMLDLDGMTFAELTGGTWNTTTLVVDGVNGLGHIPVDYVITEWGSGPGKKGAPMPYASKAYEIVEDSPTPSACPTPMAGLGILPSEPDAAGGLPMPGLAAVLVVCALAVAGARAVRRRRSFTSVTETTGDGDFAPLSPPV